MNLAAIILAAGNSSRFGDKNYKKPFVQLAGKPVWLHSTQKFVERPDVRQTIVVVREDDAEDFRDKHAATLAFNHIEVVTGGAERADSVAAALAKLRPEIDLVAIHDAARPCISDDAIERVCTAAAESGAAILAIPVTDTLKRAEGTPATITATVPRAGLWAAQTPQVFHREVIVTAYANRGGAVTDDAELVERSGHPVQLVEGSTGNLKITTRGDLQLAEYLLNASKPQSSNSARNPFADDDLWR